MSNMKLPQFLKTVDETTKEMSHEELERFIHKLAREYDEENRDFFLEKLKEKSEDTLVDENNDIIERIKENISALNEINYGEKCLDSEYNYEWDEWYNPDVNMILFYDSDGLLADIKEAIFLIHKCVDMELYQWGFKLSKVLCLMEIEIDGDYIDYYGKIPDINDLFDEELIKEDKKRLITECLLLTYMGSDEKSRLDNLYLIVLKLTYFKKHDQFLIELLKTGQKELPLFNEFLKQWISYLLYKNSDMADILLEEANSMITDDEFLLDNARKHVKVHPELYLQILETKKGKGEDEKMLEIGLEAIEKVDFDSRIYESILLCTSDYAGNLGKSEIRDNCWFSAFELHPDITNYFRIKFLSENPEKYSSEISDVITGLTEVKKLCTMLFFEKRFEEMKKTGMNTKEFLGWSHTFMKEGICLLLLLLYEGDDFLNDMKNMIEMTIGNVGFKAGYILREEAGDDSNEYDISAFKDMFLKWKETVNLSGEIAEAWIEEIGFLIDKRTMAIMEANRRNYYRECALFIAGYGQVVESIGFTNAKYRILADYRKKYPRRSAFHKELNDMY